MFTEEEVEAALEEVGYAKWGLYSDADYRAFVRFANALPVKREGELIDRENVRVGDVVLRKATVADGVKTTHEGAISGLGSGVIAMDESFVFIEADDNYERATYYLIHRPEAPKLPTEPGSLIEAYEVCGLTGSWKMILDRQGFWKRVDGKSIGNVAGANSQHITSWKPADFVVRDGNE